MSAETPGEAPGDEGAEREAEDEQPDLEAPLLVAGEGEDSDEKQALPAPPVDRSLLGLGLYALSGCFLSTMLVLTKKLSALPTLAWFDVPSRGRISTHACLTRLCACPCRPAEQPCLRGAVGEERLPPRLRARWLRCTQEEPLWPPVCPLSRRFCWALAVHRLSLILNRCGRRGLLAVRGIFGYGAIMNCARPSCAVTVLQPPPQAKQSRS